MKNLRYVCVQPAIDYYTWQVEVMLNNFIKNGINPNNMDIVCSYTGDTVPEKWRKMANTYNYVRFFFYKDTRKNPVYISSIRPNILKQHFAAHPYLKDEAIFYHDCDIIMTKPVNWDKFKDDDVWYCSDTRGYVGANYIKSKQFGIYEKMCEIIGIDESIPSDNEMNSGGAQYIMKNIDAEYWEKVEKDSEALYAFFLEHLKEHPETPQYHPIQKWTADMWAVLWNGWYYKHDIKVVPELEFTWPMHGLDAWQRCDILHNAGVTEATHGPEKTFFKGQYINKLPFDVKLEDFDPKRCSYNYVKEILETATKSCLL